jgi:ribonuclease VapC
MGRERAADLTAGTIAIDTSALIAIAFDEPECEAFELAIVEAEQALVSAVTVVETRMVLHGRKGPAGLATLDAILGSPQLEIVSPGPQEIDIAHAAFVAYGKGRGHPAQLNFGDLFSYALAKSRGVPLLYKGDDFIHTDIETAAA